ncbi:TonB system transport protein ExbD [Vespertiliibacter pulmonis]|uniref:Biopolymer transport protein ExbD n=1 Tax=Vespertiliibacter pulmonis TaxID=1443036 RepID=A0A3N4VIK1_9PAST|nr:TonB system transport protein ExbD [Vespertiliibacter pulmonis]QLB20753.1 TonB system transport protein ExbD [Vespertiliibacter pulmonis]RPE82638.1 outer membrane transport energization protein ExbD [Vespertiliibacter pulmonis]
MTNLPSEQDQELSEINVTPFIDVMLVLLIIFMVTVPLTTVTVPLDLPVAQEQPTPPTDKPLILSLNKEKQLFLGDESIAEENLVELLNVKTERNLETVIFFQADKEVNYESLLQVISRLRQGGYLKIGLVGLEDGNQAEK